MRIALVNIIKPMKGSGDGITEYTYELYEILRKSHDVDMCYSIASSRKNNIAGLVRTNLLFNFKLRKLAKEDYDVIHITNHEVGSAAKVLKGAGSRAKVVTTVHDLLRFQKGYHKGALQSAYNRVVMRQMRDIPRFSDFVLFDSVQTRSDFERIFGGSRRSRVVSLGVKEEFLSSRRAPRAKGPFTIGYIGSLAYHKNVPFILRVAERLKGDRRFRFLVYGSGVQREELAAYKEEKGLDNVRLCGFLKEDEKMRTLDSLDAFIFPTMYEGFGLPIMEAQARGIPVIICKKGRVPEEVGRRCLKAADEDAAARIIRRLLERGYPRKEREAATRYARGFTWKRAAAETFDVYRLLVKGVDDGARG
jgi:glycosyltransferase involved in cell wall biosynthesis